MRAKYYFITSIAAGFAAKTGLGLQAIWVAGMGAVDVRQVLAKR